MRKEKIFKVEEGMRAKEGKRAGKQN